MRILMLTQFYPPFIGGEERLVQNLSEGLVARGHDVAVVTLQHGNLANTGDDRGVRVYRIPSTVTRVPWLLRDRSRPHIPPLPDPVAMRAIWQILKRERPDIVHAHNWLVHSFLPLKIASRAKLVVSLHDYSLACATKKLLYRDAYPAVCTGPGFAKCLRCAGHHYGPLRGAATTLANWAMGMVERQLVDLFLPVSRMAAAGNGLTPGSPHCAVVGNLLPSPAPVTSTELAPYLTQLPPGDFLLFAGALGGYKGVDTLLEAYAGLHGAPPLVLIGYHTEEFRIRSELLLANVVILKDWPHRAVLAAWRRCQIAIVPSLFAETFGLTAAEAMAVGRPLIASRIGALPELVQDGQTGLLVPPGDADALREALGRLLADPDLRERLGRAARERARHFAAEAVLPQFEALYRRLVAGNVRDMRARF